MRKHLVHIAILAVCALGFIGIASAAPASAANCTSTIGGIYWPPGHYYAVPHTLSNCTDVSGVEFKLQPYTTGVLNLSNNHTYVAQSPPNPLVYGLYYVASSYSFTWYVYPICPAPNVVNVAKGVSVFRIRRAATGTWGGWYVSQGPNQDVWCYA